MYHVHINIQEPYERVLRAQEQSGGFEQARPFSQIKWQTGEFIEMVRG